MGVALCADKPPRLDEVSNSSTMTPLEWVHATHPYDRTMCLCSIFIAIAGCHSQFKMMGVMTMVQTVASVAWWSDYNGKNAKLCKTLDVTLALLLFFWNVALIYVMGTAHVVESSAFAAAAFVVFGGKKVTRFDGHNDALLCYNILTIVPHAMFRYLCLLFFMPLHGAGSRAWALTPIYWVCVVVFGWPQATTGVMEFFLLRPQAVGKWGTAATPLCFGLAVGAFATALAAVAYFGH